MSDLKNVAALAAVNMKPQAEPHHADPPMLSDKALYGLAGDVVNTIAPHSEAHPAAILTQFLVAFGCSVGRSPFYLVEADEHRLNLFAVLVGRSGKGRKGTSWSHIKRLFKAADPQWVKDNIASGLSSGEGLIWEVRDPVEKEENIREKGRVTGETQTVVVDKGVEDKRRLVVESEFASPLKMVAREGNVLSPTMRQAWESGDLRVMTKNSPARSTGAHIAVIAHITEEELRRLLTETEMGNGFANRFLFVAIERTHLLPDGGNLTQEDLEPLGNKIALSLGKARTIGRVERDEESRAIWRKVYGGLTEARPGIVGSILGRAEAQVLRLSTLYAVLNGSPIVRKEHMIAALALWDYCEGSVKYIFGETIGDPTADRILEMLAQSGRAGMTRSQLSAGFGRHKSGSELSRGLEVLRGRGRARCEKSETEGRTAEIWFAEEGIQ